MTVPQNDPGFLNVPVLLEASEPRQRMAWMRLGISGFVMAIMLGWFFGRQGDDRGALSIVLSVGLTLILGIVAANGFFTVRRARREQADLETIEEMIQLRRWPQSALAVQAFLSKPVQSMVGRAQAVLCMAMILARYHRFEEAVVVYDRVLAEVPLDDASAHAVRLGRAMAMLSEERLVDADRAIADLRRGSRGMESPGLALLEIYRDVKTGHPQEAIQMFQDRLEIMRKTLGHRIADAWALVARAYDLVGRNDEARVAFDNATHLTPLIELKRRYPEIGALAEKYSQAPVPAGVE